MTTKRVPVMVLPWGYHRILSEKQRAELFDTMQRAYETGESDDRRIYWMEVEAGGIEDGWCILIDGREPGGKSIIGPC